MKRREQDSSSFDLFLDTICNTFGGIVFLAILLALMIQTRAVVHSETSGDEQPPTPDEVRQQLLTLESLASVHASLSQTLEQLSAGQPGGDADEYWQHAKRLADLDTAIADAASKLAEASAALAEKRSDNAALREELDRLPDELAGAKQAVKEGEAVYLTARDAKLQTLKLPKLRTSQASSIMVLFQSGKLYPAFRPRLSGDGFDRSHVETRPARGSGIEVRPIAGGGWAIDRATDFAKVVDLVDEASRNRSILTIAIWPDMYHQFVKLRELLVERNVPYQVWFQEPEEVLEVSPGAGTSRIQ